jgi:hypothetical protein
MLGMKSYPQGYIDACRKRIDADVAAYGSATAKMRNGKTPDSTFEAFEVTFFNNMVLLLDYFFVHRLTGIEGKDGNPLIEVRVICNSLLGSTPQNQIYGAASKHKNIMTQERKYL